MKDYKKTIRDFERSHDEKAVRKLKDLKGFFSDQEAYDKKLRKGNPMVYQVFIKEYSPMNLGLTVISPGSVGKEYYHTKGHVHKAKTPEFYILIEGKGELFIQKGKKTKTIHLELGKISLIPVGYAHRLINTGRKELKVLTIYHEKSKPSYDVRFRRKFFKK